MSSNTWTWKTPISSKWCQSIVLQNQNCSIYLQVEAIKTYFVENESLFAKIARRQALWRRMIELEEAVMGSVSSEKSKEVELVSLVTSALTSTVAHQVQLTLDSQSSLISSNSSFDENFIWYTVTFFL